MTFTEAAAQVLRLVGKPLHYKEITDVAIEKNLLSHVGKSPEVTMGARLAALVKKGDKDNPLVRIKPGVFALRDWDEETIKSGLSDRTPALALIERNGAVGDDEEPDEGEAADASGDEVLEDEPGQPVAAHFPVEEVDEELATPDEEERARAEIAASATELFEAEDDDDEPIFSDAAEEDEEDDDRPGRDVAGRRRRRRRRRKPAGADDKSGDDLPSYTVSDAPLDDFEEAEIKAENRNHRDNDRARREPALTLEGLAGPELADALVAVLCGYDRKHGPVPMRKLAETAVRRGRISGNLGHVQSLLTAVARADNLRRSAAGQCPRFHLGGGRLGLTEWLLDGELARAEREVQSAVDRMRDVARRSLLRQLQQLPQRAIGELIMLLLERIGISALRPVKRTGVPNPELHLTGTLSELGGDVPVAVVVRRDGRDVGREQVIDLRGALHHYESASAGWIVTLGQVLSGAREEAGAPGAASITLLDGATLATLCERHGVGVARNAVYLSTLDAELLDALRTS